MAKKTLFQMGDRVGLINDTLTGTIVKIDRNMITVACKDGFEYVCSPKEIIKQGAFDDHLLNENVTKAISYKKNQAAIKKNEQRPITNSRKKNTLLEVDLHLHELTGSEKGMRNHDMLQLQLKTAREQLKFAMHKKMQRVVFIHGIGQGVLRDALHQMLKNYPVEVFEASYTNYGQGATEVIIYQNYESQL